MEKNLNLHHIVWISELLYVFLISFLFSILEKSVKYFITLVNIKSDLTLIKQETTQIYYIIRNCMQLCGAGHFDLESIECLVTFFFFTRSWNNMSWIF